MIREMSPYSSSNTSTTEHKCMHNDVSRQPAIDTSRTPNPERGGLLLHPRFAPFTAPTPFIRYARRNTSPGVR
ncbi:hypothetical protein N7510_000748 [Penicillium lagena]|uniref:uncharacterized protein n=1 Tax=Penicillium lagena TaxID=94218 RepID=UPI002541ED48|nr:uncharacterized protein N7510_000748 [Penicillium lagena]KAJ5624439.1 hypothetical protein N7510_000748 [Penicillium lagena]